MQASRLGYIQSASRAGGSDSAEKWGDLLHVTVLVNICSIPSSLSNVFLCDRCVFARPWQTTLSARVDWYTKIHKNVINTILEYTSGDWTKTSTRSGELFFSAGGQSKQKSDAPRGYLFAFSNLRWIQRRNNLVKRGVSERAPGPDKKNRLSAQVSRDLFIRSGFTCFVASGRFFVRREALANPTPFQIRRACKMQNLIFAHPFARLVSIW